jgi:hypothetical protein
MPREIVTQQQAGTIIVHSEVGEFSEFKVRLTGLRWREGNWP